MALILRYYTSASSSDTLAAIRAHAAYWRESEVPDTLRVDGATGVSVRSDGDRFKMLVDAPVDWTRGSRFRLRGRVLDLPDGRTEVIVRAGLSPLAWPGIMLAVIGLGGVFPQHSSWTFAFLCAVLILALVGAVRVERRLTRSTDPRLTHLIDRLERALQSLPEFTTPDRRAPAV